MLPHEPRYPAPVPERSPREQLSRSEEHTSELQSPCNLVCRLLLEKKKNTNTFTPLHALLTIDLIPNAMHMLASTSTSALRFPPSSPTPLCCILDRIIR